MSIVSLHIQTEDKFPVNYSLEVSAGERIIVLGNSGEGKTTLLHCLARQARSEGHAIGFVFQFEAKALYPDYDALNNIMMPYTRKDALTYDMKRTSAIDNLIAVGLGDKITCKPGRLSGGEQQRLGIARALTQTDGLLLMDEPISGLDRRNKKMVIDTIGALDKHGVVVVTHELEMLSIATRVIFVKKGTIIFDGTKEELIKSNEPEIRNYLQ